MSPAKTLNKSIMLIALALLSAGTCRAESGFIKICRVAHGSNDYYSHRPITLPAGLKFDDAGLMRNSDFRGGSRPVSLTITTNTDFTDSNQCAITTAQVSNNPTNHKILKSDGRLYMPAFIDNRAYFTATLYTDFR